VNANKVNVMSVKNCSLCASGGNSAHNRVPLTERPTTIIDTCVSTRRLYVQIALLFTLCTAATSPAFACKFNPSASFQTEFTKPDPEWRPDGKSVYFANGQLAIKPEPNTTVWRLYPSFNFTNATYCLDVKTPPEPVVPGTSSNAGLIFWRDTFDHFYLVTVYPDGNYAVSRASLDWTTILPITKFDKLNVGSGAVNEIKVVTLNDVVTLFFNGKKAIEFRAQAPKAPNIATRVGLFAQSSKDQTNEWRFLSLIVNE
jgi:hypothetical protein